MIINVRKSLNGHTLRRVDKLIGGLPSKVVEKGKSLLSLSFDGSDGIHYMVQVTNHDLDTMITAREHYRAEGTGGIDMPPLPIRQPARKGAKATDRPTLFQLEVLRAAARNGFLRRLPGGFWVTGDYPTVSLNHIPRAYAETNSLNAAAARGWIVKIGYWKAELTAAGRAAVEACRDLDTSSIPARNRASLTPEIEAEMALIIRGRQVWWR